MPMKIENALTKMAKDFIWQGSTKHKIALNHLHHPIEECSLNLIDIKTRNDMIEIMWLKTYLDFSLFHPMWAKITNLIIDMSMPQGVNAKIRVNCFFYKFRNHPKEEKGPPSLTKTQSEC